MPPAMSITGRPEINTVLIALSGAVASGWVCVASGTPSATMQVPVGSSINAPTTNTKQIPPPQDEDSSTAEEIARRAAASASESSDSGNDTAETAYDVLAHDLLLRIELIEMDK